MNGFWETAKREISRIKSSRFMLVMIFVLPIFFSFIIWWTFSAGTVKDLPVAVLDLDNSDISRGITRAIDSTPSADIKYRVESYNQGYDLIKSGQAYAFIVFPQHFKKDLNRNNQPKIVFYYNNQTILIGGILSKDIQSAVITSMKAVDAQIRMKKGLPKDAVMQKVNLIRVDERVKSNPYMNYAYFLAFAAIAHIFQIFAVLFFRMDIGN
jgi:ABC-2 type transport system permease protein